MRTLAALLAFAASAVAWTQGLTLGEALAEARQNSFQIQIAKSRVAQAKQRERELKGFFGPRLDGQAVYQRYDIASSFGPGVKGNIDSKNLGLSLSYPVDVIGANKKTVSAAKFEIQSAEQGLRAQELQIDLLVRSAFYDVVAAQEAVEVRKEALSAIQVRLGNARKRFEVGDIARFDIVRIETEVSQAETELATAENDLRLAKQNLNNALTRPIDTDFETEPVTALPSMPAIPEELVAIAKESRPDLQQLKFGLKAQEFLTYATRAGSGPSLNLRASYNRNLEPSGFQLASQVVLEAVLSYPIWDSGVTTAKVKQSRELETQVKDQIKQLEINIDLEVRNALVNLRKANELLQLTERTVALQKEVLRIAQVRYDAGDGILLDVTQAQADLTAAQAVRVNARNQYLTAYAALQRAVGRDDLSPAPQNP